MKTEIEKAKAGLEVTSELTQQRETSKLMNKIDSLMDNFLSSTQPSRRSTQLAATADQAMEGKGLEMGSWGMLGDAAVVMGYNHNQQSGLGSVEEIQQRYDDDRSSTKTMDQGNEATYTSRNRIVVLADIDQDTYAKQLLPKLTEVLEGVLPGVSIATYKPTATLPVGGDNAACILLFLTSLSDPSSVTNALERLLRKTILPGTGAVTVPPTQLVAISTIGTSRTNKMPYSMQNMMSGGKLDKRRQMEERVVTIVRNRAVEPPLDYTICKLGEIKETSAAAFQLDAGDVFEGTTTVDTACTVLKHAIALQPVARNATLSFVGTLPTNADAQWMDDWFLRLDGPELFRIDVDSAADFDQLAQYMQEWIMLFAESGKGVVTPVRSQVAGPRPLVRGVKKQAAYQLLFQPTNTGKYYQSRDEEIVREKAGQTPVSSSSGSALPRKDETVKEGGVEVVIELLSDDRLRLRAKRCNYAEDAVIKELSEATILSRVRESLAVWQKNHPKK